MHNRIAVLGAEVNEAYQLELYRGISDEAEKHSKQMICFLGSRPDSASGENPSPFYRLAHSGSFDGVIIVSSAVSTFLDPVQVRSLFDSRPDVPKISIGMQLEGEGSVCVDGSAAMMEITEHLVIEHKRKNFALIAGPEWHPESKQRRKVVLDTLRNHDIEIDDELFVHGSFVQTSGRSRMKELLDSGKKIDAVICLNDQMALGAIEELSNRNISVPDMVSVAGFDGIEESAYCSPPPYYRPPAAVPGGGCGCKRIIPAYGRLSCKGNHFACVPVIRQSCACRLNINDWKLKKNRNSENFNGSEIGSIVADSRLDKYIEKTILINSLTRWKSLPIRQFSDRQTLSCLKKK